MTLFRVGQYAALSAVFVFLLISCSNGQTEPVSTTVSTHTSSAGPPPTTTPNLVATPILPSTPTSLPDPAPSPVATPTLLPTPTSMPDPTPSPFSIATPTHSPATVPSYLREEIPPCIPASGTEVDPCEPDAPTFEVGVASSVPYLGDEPLSMREFLDDDPPPAWVTHLVLRGTYLPGTVRCAAGDLLSPPSYLKHEFVNFADSRAIKCYIDIRANSYVLGTGPPNLTVLVLSDPYWDAWLTRDWGEGNNGQDLLDQTMHGYEILIDQYFPGNEHVVFLGPPADLSSEVWRLQAAWAVQRREDGTVIAVHPERDLWRDLRPNDYQTHRSKLEMDLPAFTQAVNTAHQARISEYGGRIGTGSSLPMLVTDGNRLRQYYTAVGAYGPGDPIPVQPPPPCGLAVSDQASNPDLMRDCMALLAAKDTLRGSAALNWSVNIAIADWDGVTTGGTPSRVTKLLLPSKRLSGSIPGELGDLYGLTHLNLNSNSLAGTIHRELGQLSNLAEIRLSGNSLTGCIPLGLKDVSTNDLSALNLLYCPPVPQDMAASTAGENSVPLSWTAISGASKYRIEYRLYSGDWILDEDSITATSHKVDGLTCESEYLFRVGVYGDWATYAAGWSAPSKSVAAGTTECVSPVFEEDPYAFSVGEDAGIGTEVGVVSATDPQGETVTYSITEGNEDGKFAIDGSTGAITVAGILDHETTASYTLTVQASDGTNTSAAAVEITVADLNEPPVFETAAYSLTVAEDAAVGASPETVSATDPDEGDGVSYSITAGNSGGAFAIDSSTGSITVARALDYETTVSYALTVEASDGRGGTAEATVNITVTDAAEAPAFDEVSYAFEVAEDAAVGGAVGTVLAADPDVGDAVSYAITAGNADGKFAIDVGTGAISVAAALDFETTGGYSLTVEAEDSTANTDTVTVTVTVTDVAEAPVFDEASYTFEVAEDAAVGDAVGTVSATDPDEDDTLTYSITSGNAGSKFSIGSSTGEVTVEAALDYETESSYTLTVEADDGQGGTAAATVDIVVTDAAEAPAFDEASYSFEVVEDAAVGDVVGTVSAMDPDDGDAVSYSITAGNGDGKFNIDVGTGEIAVAASLDHETADSYTLTVEASDGRNGTATVAVMVTVTDVVESPPPPPTGLTVTLAEGVFTVSWTALDGTAKYEVQHRTDAADSQWTALPETTDPSVTHAPADGPVCSTEYRFRVRAFGDGDTYAEMWGVESDVEPVETATCPPEFDNASYYFLIRDTAAVNGAVGSVSATDPDQGDTLSYAITAGNGDGKFSINGTTGQLTVSGAFDIAATPFYTLTVEASDSRGGKDTAEVTVSLTIADCYNGTAVPRADERLRLVRDCSVLLTAKDALRGTASLNWSPDTPMREWHGIYTGYLGGRYSLDGANIHVKDVIVSRLGLNGSIPPLLAGLVDLRRLDLNDNQLTGEIPSELGGLSGIRYLSLYGNRLTGEIPPELGDLPNLEDLRLNRNQLIGEIPSELRGLANLRILIFNDNRLNGSIPSWLGELSELGQLWLRDNELTGSIPSELAGLDLEHLHLSGNSLSGCIPSGLRDVADNDLDRLSISYCATSGS